MSISRSHHRGRYHRKFAGVFRCASHRNPLELVLAMGTARAATSPQGPFCHGYEARYRSLHFVAACAFLQAERTGRIWRPYADCRNGFRCVVTRHSRKTLQRATVRPMRSGRLRLLCERRTFGSVVKIRTRYASLGEARRRCVAPRRTARRPDARPPVVDRLCQPTAALSATRALPSPKVMPAMQARLARTSEAVQARRLPCSDAAPSYKCFCYLPHGRRPPPL